MITCCCFGVLRRSRYLPPGNGGSPALIDGDRNRGRDTTFEHFYSEVVYLSKAGQQAHPALILNRGPVDEVITLKAGPRPAASHGDLCLLAAGPPAHLGRTEWDLRFDVHR